MNRFLVFSALCVAATTAFAQSYNNVTINAADDIYSAGNAGNPDGNQVTPYALGPNPGVLTFSGVTGSITLNDSSGFALNDPDGVLQSGSWGVPVGPYGPESFDSAYGGLSALLKPDAGELVGVFESPTSLLGPTPAELDFYDPTGVPGGIGFSSLSPLLDQVFVIGDGLTGDGTGATQQFYVPAGATELYLGIADAPGFYGSPGAYDDNISNFTASFNVSSAASTPDAGSSAWLLGAGLAGIGAIQRRFKTAAR
jgi:hypothetical protein